VFFKKIGGDGASLNRGVLFILLYLFTALDYNRCAIKIIELD